MRNLRASCAANNLQRISQSALIRPLTQTTMDGIFWNLRDAWSSSHSCYTKLRNKQNFFQDGITPHQQQTTAASYRNANILPKAMAPLQHGELVKDCLVQSGEMLFPERVDVLRTVEQVPLCQHMHKACGRHCRSLGKYYSEKFKKMGGFLSCI